MNKSDKTWKWSFNESCKSLKGILVLFEEEKPYKQDTNKFYNPKSRKSLSLQKVNPISYTLKACDLLSNTTRSASISPKESRSTPMLVRFKNS